MYPTFVDIPSFSKSGVKEIHLDPKKVLADYSAVLAELDKPDDELSELLNELNILNQKNTELCQTLVDKASSASIIYNKRVEERQKAYEASKEALKKWNATWFFKGPKPVEVLSPWIFNEEDPYSYISSYYVEFLSVARSKRVNGFKQNILDMVDMASKSEVLVFTQVQYESYSKMMKRDNVKFYKDIIRSQVSYLKQSISSTKEKINTLESKYES